MPNLYTHLDLDVDAAASIWLWQYLYSSQDWNVQLVPATWPGEEMRNDDMAIELEAEGKGIRARRNPDGTILSCFRIILNEWMPRDLNRLEHDRIYRMVGPIADLLDAQRRDGNLSRLGFPPRYGIYGLSGTFLALKKTAESETELLLEFERILDGFLHLAELSTEVHRLAEEVQFLGHQVAIISDQDNPGLHRAIFRRGAKFLVFKDGNNLGVLREARERKHLGELLSPRIEEEGWFFHPRGHLAARGTRRAPARTESRYTPLQLAEILQGALEEHVEEADYEVRSFIRH
ncbi:MAG: hypothetical protein DWQ01_05765 [Planctomycetota bacterium]|nr:MAG: hypothetical protein DWQ01_05765 [Planctomycetota bacterium]